MTPDADSFRALARSSPWRWRTLHLRARSSGWADVEAHVRRPDGLERPWLEVDVLAVDGRAPDWAQAEA